MPFRRQRLLGLLGALAMVLLAAGCGSSRRAARDAGPPPLPKPTFRIAIVTDLKGYLEPCGCTSRPLGGVHRLAGMLDRIRADRVPTAFVAVGDLFLEGDTSATRLAQDTAQAETLVAILGDLEVAAVVPGRLDRARGDAWFASVGRARPLPFIGAGAEWPSDVPARPARSIRLGSRDVAFVGATDGFGESTDQSLARLRTDAASARSAGAELVVALVRGDRRFVRAASGVAGVDFIVHGGLDSEVPEPPTRRGDAVVLEAGRQGQRLVVLDVYARGPGAYRDESPWSRRIARERLIRDRDALRARIAEWETAGNVATADLDAQRASLASLENDIRATDRSPDVATGNAFVADLVELAQGSPEHPGVKARMDAFARTINEQNRTTLAGLLPPPAPEGTSHYVGSAECQSCHEAAYTWWRGHLHGRAYATLERQDKQFNLSCVGCHVTGYGRPGGSTVTHNLDGRLVNVGCESCHGPASRHIASPRETPASVSREVPANVCTNCHNHEHSDRFDYEAYKRRILVPGHGLPAAAP